MDIAFKPSALGGCVTAASSKAYLQRLLIASSLCREETVINCNGICGEIKLTAACLNGLGADIKLDGNKITVKPINPVCGKARLDCGDSSLLVRFLIPVASALGINVEFTSSGAPVSRPLLPLRNSMESHGISFTAAWKYPLEISGKLQSGEFKQFGAMSSQYATGLLFALPIIRGDSVIRLPSPCPYKNYINMTVDIIKKFGVIIEEKDNSLYIKGGQEYVSPKELDAEGDWLSSAYLLAAGAISGKASIKGLKTGSFQNEEKILSLLKSIGADVREKDGIVSVSGGNLKGLPLDSNEIFDLVPALCVLAHNCKSGLSIISSTLHQRIGMREAPAVFSDCICAIGGASAQTDDGIIVWSNEKTVGGYIPSFNDYRIVMAMAAAALKCESEIIVTDADCVNGNSPLFLENYRKLGGVFDVINT